MLILEDHPHAYGDKCPYFILLVKVLGSSPRVWGQGNRRRKRSRLPRIIPTRMGTSRISKGLFQSNTDHPHAYGDKRQILMFGFVEGGSSPRVWGQVIFGLSYIPVFRIIPTRMGTSQSVIACMGICWDHPHAYGDKPKDFFILFDSVGSSPRVWGQVKVALEARTSGGIIPTRMGTSF